MQYQICTRCVMDTSDPEIKFDEAGICSHCREFDEVTSKQWFPNAEGQRRLEQLIAQIKRSGQGKEYDCILGLSGGVDSSYLAIKAKEWGLRPLVMHVDAGWNSELAVANVERIVKFCNYDLHTRVMNWEEMRDLHVAYLQSGVANQDIPQDHAFAASLYKFAVENDIHYVMSGGNIATESILPLSWQGPNMDGISIRGIHKLFGKKPLADYKTVSFFEYYLKFPFIDKLNVVRPLNFLDYNKDMAIEEMVKLTGWRPYERKHGESLFTKLFQNYYLPVKFGFDKRRPHYSSLIVSGQATREWALSKLVEPLYDPQELEVDIAFFTKKLRISRKQFDDYMTADNKHCTDYPNWNSRRALLKLCQRIVERLLGHKVEAYS